jgi:hypothetical protein
VRLWRWRGIPVGRYWVRTIPAICIVSIVIVLLDGPAHATERGRIAAQLLADGGSHLVIVRYGKCPAGYGSTSLLEVWVYNRADIDACPIVWARELDQERNHHLLAYFKDRTVWLLQADRELIELVPYDGAFASQSASPGR